MVKTPPYQKRGKCGHFMPQFDSHGSYFGCRAKCKGLDPCAQGADTTQCSARASLTEEQWSHLRENFAKRSAYRPKTGSQGDSFEEPETEEPVLTGEDFSRVDYTLLDLEPEDSGTSAPLTSISPLTSLPASLPAQSVPVTQLLLLWVRYNSLRLILQPFSGHHTLCLRQSHRTFRRQDIYHTQLLAGNQLRKEWQLCHSHNHRGPSQQQRSHRLLGLNSLGASWSSRILR